MLCSVRKRREDDARIRAMQRAKAIALMVQFVNNKDDRNGSQANPKKLAHGLRSYHQSNRLLTT